jgi:hypothetical protein
MSSANTTGVNFIYTVRDEFPGWVSDDFPVIVVADKIENP